MRPALGINVVDDGIARSIEQQLRRRLEGVLVTEVLPNSQAQKAGLQAMKLQLDGTTILGDLITKVNGQVVRQVEDLLTAIEEKGLGDLVQLSVQCGYDPRRTKIVLVRLVSSERRTGTTKITTVDRHHPHILPGTKQQTPSCLQ